MILADTSVWVEHFRRGLPDFATYLSQGKIVIHSVIIGELATGYLTPRKETLSLLQQLPHCQEADTDECLFFIEQNKIFGSGIGWCDVQLLAAAKLSKVSLWSLDKPLQKVTRILGMSFLKSAT